LDSRKLEPVFGGLSNITARYFRETATAEPEVAPTTKSEAAKQLSSLPKSKINQKQKLSSKTLLQAACTRRIQQFLLPSAVHAVLQT